MCQQRLSCQGAFLVLLLFCLNLQKVQMHLSLGNANSAMEIDPKIIGGYPIQITQAPWQVSVRLKVYDNELFGSGHICGGSVITPRVVLSAAHCVANTGVIPMIYRSASEFSLVMGSIYLYDMTQYSLRFNVLQALPNSAFNLATLANDIALFFIDGYIPANSPTVQPIALNQWPVASGTLCTVTGWGTTNSGYISSILLSATVPIVSNAVCSTNYGAGNITAGMLCAGYMKTGGVDACHGDSGGPLVCNKYLVGVVSWGNGCAESGYPGVYTNVSYYNQWITWANSTFNYTYYENGATVGSLRSPYFVLATSMICLLFGFLLML